MSGARIERSGGMSDAEWHKAAEDFLREHPCRNITSKLTKEALVATE